MFNILFKIKSSLEQFTFLQIAGGSFSKSDLLSTFDLSQCLGKGNISGYIYHIMVCQYLGPLAVLCIPSSVMNNTETIHVLFQFSVPRHLAS